MIVGCQFVCPWPFQWFPEMIDLPNTDVCRYLDTPGEVVLGIFVHQPCLTYIFEGDWIVEIEGGWQLVRRKDEK